MVFIDHHDGTRYTLIEHISNSPSGIFYIEDSMILGDYSVSGKLPPGKFPPGKFPPIKLPPRKSTPPPPGKFRPRKFSPRIFPPMFLNIPTRVFKKKFSLLSPSSLILLRDCFVILFFKSAEFRNSEVDVSKKNCSLPAKMLTCFAGQV